MLKEIYIVDAARTAQGSFGGSLAGESPAKLSELLMRTLIERNKLDPGTVDEVTLGSVLPAGHAFNIARTAAVNSGIPVDKTAMTINFVCGSGLRSVTLGAQAIQCEDAELILAGGVENMSQAPYLLDKARYGYRLGPGELKDTLITDGLTDPFENYHMGITAENIAEKYGITREAQDEYACQSQNRAEAAQNAGKFKDEIVPVVLKSRKGETIFDADEGIRAGANIEGMAKLKPVFKKDGTVTAGNSSTINDGASLILITGDAGLKKHNLTPMARIVAYAYRGCDPAIMGMAPVPSVKACLERAGWKLDDVELIEANEAFAAQTLGVAKELQFNTDIVNVNGGAIALGHPLAASGARITTTLLYEMKRRSVKKGLSTLCIGGGLGIAMAVEIM